MENSITAQANYLNSAGEQVSSDTVKNAKIVCVLVSAEW
jgi:hypothetical protein